MSGEYGSDIITIVDEDGSEFEFEHIDTFEFKKNVYLALLPADMDENSEDFGIVILKAQDEDGEEILVTIDDENELEEAYEYYMQFLFDEDGD